VSRHRAGGLHAAWTFLTRVPLGHHSDDTVAMAAAPAWFPIIGAIIGVIAGGVYVAAFSLAGPVAAAALAVSAAALVTGAFHHDGLADMADAFGGGWTREQRIEILKDSRHGTYGVMALVCAIAVQISALAQHDRAQGFASLVAAHAMARGGAVALMWLAPRARGTGLGADYARGLRAGPALWAATSAALVGAVAIGWLASIALGAVAVSSAAVGALAWRKIGGVTGDVLGAAEQISETAVLVCGAAFVRHVHTWPWWR
jgi:adenosylcobinamide-GDP ribazoletransferase